MNGAAGLRRVRLLLDRAHGERRAVERGGERARARPRRARATSPLRLAVVAEVAALRDALARRPRRASPRTRPGSNVPTMSQYDGGDERHPLALALDHEPRRDRLHAAGREPRHDLPPEHGRDLVAVEPVEDPARLLRVDEAVVDLAGLAERALDRILRDLVEHHPLDRHLRLQHLEQVPGDRLALAVLVRREQELGGVLQLALQLVDLLLLVGIDDVERLEVVVDVDAEARPRLLLHARPGCRRRDSEDRGCGRSTTRRRSRRRGTRRWSLPWRETRR